MEHRLVYRGNNLYGCLRCQREFTRQEVTDGLPPCVDDVSTKFDNLAKRVDASLAALEKRIKAIEGV